MREAGVPWDAQLFLKNALQSNNGMQLVIKHVDKLFLVNGVSGGSIDMSDGRSISVIGNVNGSAINTGDNVNQTVNWGVQENQTFEKLLSEIKNITELNVDDVQDATEILGDLKKKSEEGTLRPSFLQRMWDQLPKAVTLLQGATEVYKNFIPS